MSHEIVLRRWFRQPPERVWAAWTDPERLDRWFGPDGFVTTTESFAFEVGGTWVFTMAHPVRGSFANEIRFTAIEPPHRLAYDHLGDVSFEVEVELRPSSGGTALTQRSRFPTAEALRRVVENFGAIEGGRQHLSHLEAFLERTPRVRVAVAAFSVSLDGFGAGLDQGLDTPMGVGGMALHEWALATHTFRSMHLGEGGSRGVDDDFAARSFQHVGAWILGRNMFGPVRGPWPDEAWRGWWGEEPPYHTDVFVLTHHARPPLEMAGGTTFHFVTDGLQAALARARESAGDRDIRIGGGVSTVRQALVEGLVDEVHLAIAPVVLGRGEALFTDLDLPALGFTVSERVPTEAVLHVVLRR